MAKKLEVRVVQLEDGQKAIMDKLVEMNKTLTGMDHVIRGNGTPGLVATQQTHDLRIKTLEGARKSWREWLVLITSGGVVAMIAHFIR